MRRDNLLKKIAIGCEILIACLCLSGMLLGGATASAFTPDPQSPMAQRVHPRLHITPATIPTLRNAIATHYPARFQSYVDWAAADDQYKNIISGAGHDLIVAVMVHQAFISALGPVTGIQYPLTMEQFARKAIDRFLAQLRSGAEASYVAALVYDWTYNFMTPAERVESATLLAAAKIAQNDSSVNISVANPVYEPENLFSSDYYESCYPWYIGAVLWGDGIVDAEADRAVETFSSLMLNHGFLDALNFVAGNGGGWDEWIGYSNWHPQSHALLIGGWHTATGQNYVADSGTVAGNALRNYPKFIHYAADPHKYYATTYTYLMMGGSQTTDTEITDNRSQLSLLFIMPRMLAGAGLSSEAGLLRHFLDGYGVSWNSQYHVHDLWAFLGVPNASSPVTPQQAGLPKSNWSENIGLFLARTGFTSQADGVFFVSDGHFSFALDRGIQTWPGFGLTKFGPLVSTRNVAHRGYGNLSDYPGGQKLNIVYFEGGHGRSHSDVKNRQDLQNVLTGQGDYDKGGIEQIVTHDGVFYHVRVNRARSFTEGVQHHREHVWLPGTDPTRDSDFLVVYDRTASPSKPHWIYHVPWRPEVSGYTNSSDLTLGSGLTGRIGTAYEGAQLLVKELNATGEEKDNDGGTANFTGGAGAHGVLFARTILPLTARVEVTRVADFDSNVLGRQGDLAIKSHRWQVDVIPVESVSANRFLHVFAAADANLTSSMVPTTYIQSAKAEGVLISRQSAQHPHHVVLFKKQDENAALLQYSVTGQGQVRHIITGLVPDANYKIEELSGGSMVLTKTTEKGQLWNYRGVDVNNPTGTLFFESTISGTHTYKLTRTGASGDTAPPSPPARMRIGP